MPLPRLIPCLDVSGGRVVKGVQFVGLREVGDPVELGGAYSDAGADELVFLDISATLEERGTFVELVGRVAERLAIPFTVGGGIRAVADAEALLRAGADKVSVNSAALERPELSTELAERLGSQAVVVAIDADGRRGPFARGDQRDRRDAPQNGRASASARGAGESCLRRSTRTARARATTSSSPRPSPTPSPCRSSRPAAPARRAHVADALKSRRRRCSRRSSTKTRRGSRACAPSCATSASRFAMPPEGALRAAIVQDAETGRVLMLAWMDAEAERLTRETGEAWFWSRSRQELWHKGATSGNTLAVEELRDDCDGDALLVRVRPNGPACHTGSVSCFAPALWRTRRRARSAAAGRLVCLGLLDAGVAACARKVGEEGVEAAIAATSESDERVVEEVADLWFHSYVLLASRGLDPAAVEDELARRRR